MCLLMGNTGLSNATRRISEGRAPGGLGCCLSWLVKFPSPWNHDGHEDAA